MRYVTVLDRENLSNNLFITTFAQTLREHSSSYSVVLHADSSYTESLIQTGMMREDAEMRCTRELNRRLVALMADEGVATIAMNGYQRDTVCYDGTDLNIDSKYLNSLSESPALLLSNLARNKSDESIVPVPLPLLANRLAAVLNLDEIIVFSDQAKETKSDEGTIPDAFKAAEFPFKTISLKTFKDVSKINKTKLTNI